jgi:protein involved in polysaccharide export with SLBB domain
MKNKLSLLLLFIAIFVNVDLFAQISSMSDSQVMDFVIKENEKGTSREDIVKKLIERDVPIQQIQRIRKKYESQLKNKQVGAKNLDGDKINKNRNRASINDEDKPENKENFQRRSNKKVNEDNLSEKQKKILKSKREDDYDEEIDFMMPDSVEMFDEALGLRKKKKTKVIFGHNIFNNDNLSFEPNMNIATPSDYVLGPGDNIYIDVYGASQRSFNATISPDGNVDLEGYGPISLSGMTVVEANKHVKATLGKRYKDSNLKLTVGQTKSITINVMGEVKYPGTYTLSAFSSVFHALYMAGGVNDIGTLRDIKVFRNGKTITSVDIYDYIFNGTLTGNINLNAGDVIYVGPYNCLVNATGKLKRPMFYEMKASESLGTLVKYAGGFAGDAFQDNIRVIRKAGGRYSVYTIESQDRNSFKMMDGDSVFVDSALARYSNLVEIKGAIHRPGKYQVDGTISTVRQLVNAAGGPTEDAFMARAILYSRGEDRTLKAQSIDLRALMDRQVSDVSLSNEDIFYIPSRKDIQSERILTISGEVAFPGEYEFIENLTLEDFILQAGGLTDAASVTKVDVSRRIRNSEAQNTTSVLSESFCFSLKDGFVIDGTPGFILQPYDEVFVRHSPGYVKQQHVEIEGEVAFCGSYALTKKESRLSDLVKVAGGLTSEAYAKGARLERKLTPTEKLKQQSMLKLLANGDSINVEKLELGDTRLIGINLDMAIENPGSEWDVVLQQGDKLIVPQFNNTVSINGQVMYPNTIAYKSGETLRYYVDQAGGYGQGARKRRAFVIHMNGTVSKIKSSKDIQPGCEIVIPSKKKRKNINFMEILSLGSITATLGSVIATLLKK